VTDFRLKDQATICRHRVATIGSLSSGFRFALEVGYPYCSRSI
jgi:hypothetical protein